MRELTFLAYNKMKRNAKQGGNSQQRTLFLWPNFFAPFSFKQDALVWSTCEETGVHSFFYTYCARLSFCQVQMTGLNSGSIFHIELRSAFIKMLPDA